MNHHFSLPALSGKLLVLLFCFFISSGYAEESALYVSPDGNDTWTGDNLNKPFKTVQKARDIIRQMKKDGKFNNPVTVYIRGGIFELSEPLLFTLEDSGTESCPITYTAYNNEKPIISGGQESDRTVEKL